jgi:hypothetical protein
LDFVDSPFSLNRAAPERFLRVTLRWLQRRKLPIVERMLTFRSSFWAGVFFLLASIPGRADLATAIPNDWVTRAPTPERITLVRAQAVGEGWQAVASRLFQGSLKGYELRQEGAAENWYYVARWCDLLGQSQRDLGRQWLETVSKAGGIHAGIDQRTIQAWPDEPVARLVTDETLGWLLQDQAFSAVFFDLLAPTDCLPRVLSILQSLREADGRRFATYKQLALAVALVYDAPPPPHWPHHQVTAAALPRRLHAPVEAFKFLADLVQAGSGLHKLTAISAAELKFVVDLAAPFPELVWAQKMVKFSLPDLVKSYEAVRYRTDRIDAKQYTWPGTSYALDDIRSEGGICVDQAYFATQTGKARGVPTLLFCGAGLDGRHAWFGYLGVGQKWVLDGGRYAEQRYVTGTAYDPQSWGELSDHELSFLSEGFRRLPPYRQSRQHQVFAELYLRLGQKPAAAAAARKAVQFERRNFDAWQVLVAANDKALPSVREPLLREAAQALQRYPDLNASFVRELVVSLRARGETSVAEFEERTLVRRGQRGGRSDMAVDHAVSQLASAKPDARLSTYKQMLQKYGRGTGIDFYDRVTRPLVTQLVSEKRIPEARQVITLTRDAFDPEPNSQFDRELAALAATPR